jgi:hypothetical protein
MKLLPGYRKYLIDSFSNLIVLDDKVITREERIQAQDFQKYESKSFKYL